MGIHKNARLTFIRREQLAQHVLLRKMTLQAADAGSSEIPANRLGC